MDDHQEWEELAAGYALDALSPEEEQAFAAHLATCERCTADVDQHSLVAAQLGALSTPDEPLEAPSWSAMRAAVLGADREDAAVPAALPDAPAADVVDLAARRRRYAGANRLLAAAAAVVVVAVGGVVVWHAEKGSSAPTGSASSCTVGCHAIQLDDQSGAVAASLTVRGSTITMTPSGMKPAAPGTEYVLWQQPADGRPVAVSVFTRTGRNAVGTATTGVTYADTTAFAISTEHTGAVPPSPTRPLVAVGGAT